VARFLLRRAAWGLVTLIVFASIAFFAVHLVFPYDYVGAHAMGLSPDEAAAWQAELGLDRPLVVQWLAFLAGLARGDLGTSFSGVPVRAVLVEQALGFTLLVFVIGGILAYIFGSWLGRLVAWQRSRVVGGATTTAAVLAYSAFPPWLVFILLYFLTEPLWRARAAVGLPADSLHVWRASPWEQETVLWRVTVSLAVALVVALLLRWALRRLGLWRGVTMLALPGPFVAAVAAWYGLGFGDEATDLLFRGSLDAPVGRGSVLVLFLAFMLLAFGEIAFVTRTAVSSERPEHYVATARAKGLSEAAVREIHVAPNAMLPALSRFFVSLPYIITGLVIIEREFALAGLSSTLFAAVEVVDVPLILGVLVVVGLLILGLRLSLEVVHAVVDPRLRIPSRVR
jgi:ABC-type dipeptide/oligopeptide/nickel transport system permease component